MAPILRICAVVTLAALAGCGRRVAVAPAPASPEATVGQFLAAVNANDHDRIAALFGDERGPSSVTWARQAARRDSVITIMQHLLLCDSSRVMGTETAPDKSTWRVLRMLLIQGEKRTAVPFTLAPQAAGGWLVARIDLEPLMPAVNTRQRP